MKAQVSIEYLLLLAAFFSFLLLIVPSMGGVYNAGIFGLDARNARSFLNSFESSVKRLSLFGDGSEEIVSAKILTLWRVYSDGEKIFVFVESSELAKSKELSAELSLPVKLNARDYTGEINILLRKQNGRISVIGVQ